MGTQKNGLNETVLLRTQNTCLNYWIRRYSHFSAKIFPYSGLMYRYSYFSYICCQKGGLNLQSVDVQSDVYPTGLP